MCFHIPNASLCWLRDFTHVNTEDDDALDEADAATPVAALVPFTVLTRSWSWPCAKCSAVGSYGTEVPVSIISSSPSVILETLVALGALFADELAVNDDFFLLRLVR
uniref:Uncharacterized protein n=1 Tax=Anopheles culicifacies TaxID=139723 RepID=A0A182MDZ7_9DIPT